MFAFSVGELGESTGQSGGILHINEAAFSSLVKLAVKSDRGLLDTAVHHILKHHLCPSHARISVEDTILSSEVSNDSITAGIESVMMSLHLSSSGEFPMPPPHYDLSSTRLLVTTSDMLMTEKIDRICSSLSTSCLHNPRFNRIFESSETNLSKKCSHSQSHFLKFSALSNKMLKRLLKHCINHLSTASADIVPSIFQSSDSMIDYFDSELLSTVCDRLISMENGSCGDEEQLCVLRTLLSYLEHSKGREETAVKMNAKQLWKICCDLLSSESIEVQVC